MIGTMAKLFNNILNLHHFISTQVNSNQPITAAVTASIFEEALAIDLAPGRVEIEVLDVPASASSRGKLDLPVWTRARAHWMCMKSLMIQIQVTGDQRHQLWQYPCQMCGNRCCSF